MCAEFSSLSKLRKHKKNTNHQNQRRKSGQEEGQTKKARGSAPLFQQYLQELKDFLILLHVNIDSEWKNA